MEKTPSIEQYLLSTCLFIIDEFNELYTDYEKPDLKSIADSKYNEMDITVRLGYPFKNSVHYTIGDGKRDASKTNHDLYVESKDFIIEVKYLKNWDTAIKTSSNKKKWDPYQADFDWLFSEIDNGKKHKRAFVIGWFNCVDHFGQLMQLGQRIEGKRTGKNPLLSEERFCYFPFLRKTKSNPTYTSDIKYEYSYSYMSQKVKLIGETAGDYDCLFLGNESDVFHFAIYY